MIVVAGVSELLLFLNCRLECIKERIAVVYGRDGGCILCRRVLAWTGQQQHDPRATSGTRPSLGGIDAWSQRLEDAIDGLAGLYCLSLDAEGVHDYILLTINVCTVTFLFLCFFRSSALVETHEVCIRDGVNNMVIRIRIGGVLLVITFLTMFLSILFGCTPISKHWQIYPDPGSASSPF